MNGIRIISTGRALPEKIVTNDDYARTLDTSDAWIRERTGIGRRHIASGSESGESLATASGRLALERSGIPPERIGACIVATVGPDTISPTTANRVAANLGLSEDIPSFDLSAACSGFLYSLRVAQGLIADSDRPYALVIGCELLSRALDFTDRSTCVLFGDGAGAVVIAADPQAEFYSTLGSRADELAIRVPGPSATGEYITMDGRRVFRFAVKIIPQTIRNILAQSGRTLEDVDWVICHQANKRIIDHAAKTLKADPGKFYQNMDHFGNTSAASIPLALDEMAEKGLLQPGMTLMLVGFGGGLTWGGAMITYQ